MPDNDTCCQDGIVSGELTLHIAPAYEGGWRYRLAQLLAPRLFMFRPITFTWEMKDDSTLDIGYRLDPGFDTSARTAQAYGATVDPKGFQDA